MSAKEELSDAAEKIKAIVGPLVNKYGVISIEVECYDVAFAYEKNGRYIIGRVSLAANLKGSA